MTHPANMFVVGGTAPRVENLQLAWMDAAEDAREAYVAWRDADWHQRADAFVVYRAALDREEAAASALQQGATG